MIAMVGCGFVGSIFADEMFHRAYAGKLTWPWLFIDYDQVEPRNAANQNYLVTDNGLPKAEVLKSRAEYAGLVADAKITKLTQANMHELLEGASLVVDAVDNLEARQALYFYGMGTKVPVLHIGVSELGTANVEWSHPECDTFHLAPRHTAGKTIVDPPSGVTPPCELARMRGVGLNASFAAAKAAAIYLGFDPEAEVDLKDSKGWMTTWIANPTGHRIQTEFSTRVKA